MSYAALNGQFDNTNAFAEYGYDQALQPECMDLEFVNTSQDPVHRGYDDQHLDHIDEWMDYEFDVPKGNVLAFSGDDNEAWPMSTNIEFLQPDIPSPGPPSPHPRRCSPNRPNSREQVSYIARSTRSRRLPKDQTDILDNWLSDHLSYPYPTESEKLKLVAATGMTKKQIQDWFARTRQRKLPPPDVASESDPNTETPTPAGQSSLEVTPASPNASEVDLQSEGYLSDVEKLDHQLELLDTSQNLGDHPGSKLEWWLQTLPTPVEGWHRKCLDGTDKCRTRLLADARLQSLAESLEKRNLPPLNTGNAFERALLRLLDLVDVNSWAARPLCSLIRKLLGLQEALPLSTPRVSDMLNQIDCQASVSPRIDLAVEILRGCRNDLNASPEDGDEAYDNTCFTKSGKFERALLALTDDFAYHYMIRAPRILNVISLLSAEKDPMDQGLIEQESSEQEDVDRNEDPPASLNQDSISVDSMSTSSSISACSYTSFGPRRGRRRPRTQIRGTQLLPANSPVDESTSPGFGAKSNAHTCKECSESFKTKYSLKRHRASIHQPREIWVCDANVLRKFLHRANSCLLCPRPREDEALLSPCLWDSHDPSPLSGCLVRPVDKRTFYRKDLFIAHLQRMHLADKDSFVVRHARLFKQEVTSAQEQYYKAANHEAEDMVASRMFRKYTYAEGGERLRADGRERYKVIGKF